MELSGQVVQLQIEYRSPYKARHSAISHALSNGANFISLANQTGHDKRVLLSTYARAIELIEPVNFIELTSESAVSDESKQEEKNTLFR